VNSLKRVSCKSGNRVVLCDNTFSDHYEPASGDLRKQLSQTTKLLNTTKEKLNRTRQSLSELRDRLTVTEQVSAATQQRALQECDNAELHQLLELIPQHQPASLAGKTLMSENSRIVDSPAGAGFACPQWVLQLCPPPLCPHSIATAGVPRGG